MKLKALRNVRYAGEDYLPDDEFEATERDARILTLMGAVRPASEACPVAESGAPARTYRTRRLKAED